MAGGVPQTIPYQGSKRRIADVILAHFPSHVPRLVEPFAGSAAISLAMAARNASERYWLNDAHSPLMRLWQEIVRRPASLADAYERLWHAQLGQERRYFDIVRQRFNQSHEPADFLYLLARCVKAGIRYNSRGEFNNSPDIRRRGARPEEMRRRILQTSKLLEHRTELTSWDYRSALDECEDGDLIYMDPPYQGVRGNRDRRYLPPFDHLEFCAALAELIARGAQFAVSYDGRTGAKTYGDPLPSALGLTRLEIPAGRSTQATLLGRADETYESLYLSPALAAALIRRPAARPEAQLALVK